VYDLPSNPLAITSVSSGRDGRRALASSLDGSVVLVDVSEGRILGKVETGREKAASGEQGEEADPAAATKHAPTTFVELPAFTSALHPDFKCWAWSGRSSKVGIRPIEEKASDEGLLEDGPAQATVGRGPLGGEGRVIDTGKGKFTMSLNFVSGIGPAQTSHANRVSRQMDGHWPCRPRSVTLSWWTQRPRMWWRLTSLTPWP
jgi:WD repeat-containing protein 61